MQRAFEYLQVVKEDLCFPNEVTRYLPERNDLPMLTKENHLLDPTEGLVLPEHDRRFPKAQGQSSNLLVIKQNFSATYLRTTEQARGETTQNKN